MKFSIIVITLAAICRVLVITSPVQAYAYPIFGGEMIMPEIYFNGQGIVVLNEYGQTFATPAWNDPPILNALPPGQGFDPCEPWIVLTGKAHNLQYGPESGSSFPPDIQVFFKVDVFSQTPGLETYYADSNYDPLFGTAGSSNLWLWDKGMHHNAYAVPESMYGRWTATYEVYVGDSAGEKLFDPSTNEPYLSSFITYRWMRPCPWVLTGDINSDCVADFSDFAIMAAQWANSCTSPDWCDNADITRTGEVDFIDLVAFSTNWLIDCQVLPRDAACVVR